MSQSTAPRLLFVTFCKQHHPSAFSEPLWKQHVEAQSLPTAQQPTQHWVTAVRSSLLLSPQGCFSSAFPPGVYLVPSEFPETSPKQHCCKRAQSSACPERNRTERAISSPKHLQMLPCLEISAAGGTNHRKSSLQYSASTKILCLIESWRFLFRKMSFPGIILGQSRTAIVQAFLQHPVFSDTANDVTTSRAAKTKSHWQEQQLFIVSEQNSVIFFLLSFPLTNFYPHTSTK